MQLLGEEHLMEVAASGGRIQNAELQLLVRADNEYGTR